MLTESILNYKPKKNFVRMPFGELAFRMNWCRREKTFNLHLMTLMAIRERTKRQKNCEMLKTGEKQESDKSSENEN